MSLDQAATLLRSRVTEDRIRAVNRIVSSDETGRQSLLLTALTDRSNYVAAMAADALANSADSEALKVMDERFLWICEDGVKRDPGCHIRAALALGFGQQAYSPARETLRVGIKTVQIESVGGVPFDTAAHLRAHCALALAAMHAPDALRDIGLLLYDMSGFAMRGGGGDPSQAAEVKVEPRKAAARALSILRDPNGIALLAIKLAYPGNEKADVIQECIQALIELDDPRALEVLGPYLDHFDRHLAAFTGVMLAQSKRPEVLPRLAAQMERLTGDPLKAVALAVTTMRIDEAREELTRLLDEAGDNVRVALIDALAGTREKLEREHLERLSKNDKSTKVREAAAAALK